METETDAAKKAVVTTKEDINGPSVIPQSTEEKEATEKRKREGEAEEEPDRGPLWKTSLCSYFRSKQGCSHGESCRYAHGEEELRPRPDKTWDPTSERAKKLQKKAEESKEESESEEEEGLEDETGLDKCLIGLPRNWGSDALNKFLDGQGIHYKSAKKKKRMAVAFVVFEDVEQVKDAIKILNEKSDGGKQIKIANATRRSNEKRHSFGTAQGLLVNEGHDEDAARNDTSVTEGLVPKTRSARDVVTPLAHMPYTDQLEHKKNSLLQTLKRLVRKIRFVLTIWVLINLIEKASQFNSSMSGFSLFKL